MHLEHPYLLFHILPPLLPRGLRWGCHGGTGGRRGSSPSRPTAAFAHGHKDGAPIRVHRVAGDEVGQEPRRRLDAVPRPHLSVGGG
jgi:hypothetical protein